VQISSPQLAWNTVPAQALDRLTTVMEAL
jgi:hypothetical protein